MNRGNQDGDTNSWSPRIGPHDANYFPINGAVQTCISLIEAVSSAPLSHPDFAKFLW
jgi:hypothetical protein